MSVTHEQAFSCPYCMAPNSLTVDPVHDIEQQFIVDCQVCCQPIDIMITQSAGEFLIDARTGDE